MTTKAKAKPKAHRLTKASVLRALESRSACSDAVEWFRGQRSLQAAWKQLCTDRDRYESWRCWIQTELGYHQRSVLRLQRRCHAEPVSFAVLTAAACKRGWWL